MAEHFICPDVVKVRLSRPVVTSSRGYVWFVVLLRQSGYAGWTHRKGYVIFSESVRESGSHSKQVT